MSDTETTTRETTKRPKRASSINSLAGTVTLDGREYSLANVPDDVIRPLALRGLRQMLAQSDSPIATMDELLHGRMPGRAPTKVRVLDPWREAAAHARAEGVCRQKGLKPRPGQKLVDSPDFKSELDDARQVVAGWSKKTLLQAKGVSAVIEWHSKLAGPGVSLDALFEGAASVADAEMDEAAD